MNAIKPYLSTCLVGLVWFARYCGKMCSHHQAFFLWWIAVQNLQCGLTKISVNKVKHFIISLGAYSNLMSFILMLFSTGAGLIKYTIHLASYLRRSYFSWWP